jgi:hypothetical protein
MKYIALWYEAMEKHEEHREERIHLNRICTTAIQVTPGKSPVSRERTP